MNYRRSEILAAESIATAGTKTIDINLADPISRLSLIVRLTGSGDVPTAHPAKSITKIEVIDGSKVVFSMKGIAAIALDWFDTFVEPLNSLTYLTGIQAWAVFNLNFGRWLFDPDLALDPKRFNNLQLKVTHNYAAGGCNPSAGTLRVMADVFDEKVPSLRGYLCSKEHYSVPDSNSDINYVDLPTDQILRKLMIQAYANDKYPYNQVSSIKLSEDHDKRVVLDESVSDFLKLCPENAKLYHEFLYGAGVSAGRDFYITPAYLSALVMNPVDAATGYCYNSRTAGCLQNLSSSASGNFAGLVTGWCPLGAFVVPFGDQEDASDWYDVTRIGKLQLKITQGSSVSGSETIETITQQLIAY